MNLNETKKDVNPEQGICRGVIHIDDTLCKNYTDKSSCNNNFVCFWCVPDPAWPGTCQ